MAKHHKEFDDCPGEYDSDCGGKLRRRPGDPQYPELYPPYLECDVCQWTDIHLAPAQRPSKEACK